MNDYGFIDDMPIDERLELFGYLKGRMREEVATDYAWPELRDPRDHRDAPGFPLNRVPGEIAEYSIELSKGSGFDPGAYAFACLVAVSNLVDQRARLDVGPFSVPPFLWGGILDDSSGGKSPIMGSACRFVYAINKNMLERSKEEKEHWEEECRGIKGKQNMPEQPKWRQFVVEDITVECLAELSPNNPTGLFYIAEEFTEFIGRMDAYNSNGKSGKDRGVYLKAWDGKSTTINRSGKGHSYIESFSLGLLAGIQPQKLAEMYRRTETQSDGLFQRFLMYRVARAQKTDYAHRMPSHAVEGFRVLCENVWRSTREGAYVGEDFRLSDEARREMELFHNTVRTFCQNSGAGDRAKEHIGKYPGIVARIALTLHAMEHHDKSRAPGRVELDTYRDAEVIAKTLMQHALSVYEWIDATGSKSAPLIESACETILAKKWEHFLWGDLTREAAGWRKADEVTAEHAINMLIDFGWINDQTTIRNANPKGRRAAGFYEVNPRAHMEYEEAAQEIIIKRHLASKSINSLLPPADV